MGRRGRRGGGDFGGAECGAGRRGRPGALQFKLPSTDAVHDFERLGLSMDHGVQHAEATALLCVSAWATDEELALARAHGYEAVGTIPEQVRHRLDPRRARRDARRSSRPPRRAARERRKAKGKSCPRHVRAQRAGLLREQRRPLPLDRGQRRRRALHRHDDGTYTGPTVDGRVVRRRRQPHRRRPASTSYIDPDVSPDYYQYHYDDLPGRQQGRRRRHARHHQDRGAQRRRRHASPSRNGSPRSRPPTRPASSRLRRALQRLVRGVREDARPRHRVPEHLRGDQAAGEDRAATSAGRRRCSATERDGPRPRRRTSASTPTTCPVAGTAPTTAQQPGTVVLTSKSTGHLGGNSLTAQIVDPAAGAANQALSVSPHRQRDPHQPGDERHGAITSTAAQVVDAINATRRSRTS